MSSKQQQPTRSALRLPEIPLEPPVDDEPYWIGWVYALDGVDGYRRWKVRIPISFMEELSEGEPSAPDLRGTVMMGALTDAMTDTFLLEMARAKRGER